MAEADGNKPSGVTSEDGKVSAGQGLDAAMADKGGESGTQQDGNLKQVEKNSTSLGDSKRDGNSKKTISMSNGVSVRTIKGKGTIIVEPNIQITKPDSVNKPVQSSVETGSTAVNKKNSSPSKSGNDRQIKDTKSQKSNDSEKLSQREKDKETNDKRSEIKAKEEKKKSSDSYNGPSRSKPLSSNKEPTFVIAGGNGVALVENALTELGWKRNLDKQSDNFKLKWVECRASVNYNSFKEGEQLVNRIPNNGLLTNKMGLLGSLQTYARVTVGMKRGAKLKLTDFLPETYRLDDPKDREEFLATYKEGEIWICKPTGMNQGKGIYLVQDLDELKKNLQDRDEKAKAHKRSMGRIIQRYIHKPLLLEGRKFDVRAYMLIASTTPYLLLYHKGYVRLSMQKYDNDISNLTAHLTNQFIQKKDPNYKENKETTAWSMEYFNDYINENVAEDKGLEQDWVFTTFTARMKQIMTQCFKAVQHKLECKMGFFDLYGLDFMIDEDMKIWLIEVNVNPSLATNCTALRDVIPGVVKETLNLVLECNEKCKRNQPLLPLQSQSGFQVLYNGGTTRQSRNSASPTRTSASTASEGLSNGTVLRSKSLSPVRRTRSLSPVKEASSNEVSKSQNRPAATRATPATRTTVQTGAPATAGVQRTSQHPHYERSPYSMAVATSDPIRLKMTHAVSARGTRKGKGEKSDRGN